MGNTETKTEKGKIFNLGEIQRAKNKSKITDKKEIRKHEEKIVEEIKQDKGGKVLWKNIR